MTVPTQPVTDMIAEYERHLAELSRAESTIETYVESLRRMDRQLPAGLLCAHTDELRDWIYTDRRSKATRHLLRAIVCGFFEWATHPAGPRLDFDPAQLLPRVGVPERKARPIPTGQLYDILGRARQPYADWFLIAAYAGLRCIEIGALDKDHVTETHIWIQGKGDKERLVPTHPLVWAAVQQLPDGPVAPNGIGRLNRQQISHRASYHLKTLGHADVSMHRLRHWFGTAAYEASERDIRVVQELLGHASVSTTQRYIAVGAGRKALAVTGLPQA